MCYVKSAPTFTPQQQQQQQQQQLLQQHDQLYRQPAVPAAPVAKQAPFSFTDLSLDTFNDGGWLNVDADAILGNPFSMLGEASTPGSMEFGLNLGTGEDFLPWLESITGPANPATEPKITEAPPKQQPTLLSPPHSTPEVMIKQDPSVSPYLPSPTSGFAASESPFPSLTSGSSMVTPASSDVSPSPPPADIRPSPSFRASSVAPKVIPAPKPKTAVAKPKKAPTSKKRPADESEDDDTIMKRMKNTEAARRSRARKLAKLETLEAEVTTLEHDKATLLVRLAVLESEQATFVQRENDLNKRIAQLEFQLAESHRAMVLGMQR
ncbi:hypothetical protein HDU67_007961 [Dinochytrium kinnereticum]|nr:hypothetical protein HDU67_007961 [Dinochytrium kinnereticum]